MLTTQSAPSFHPQQSRVSERVCIGKTDIEVSRFALGGAPFGGAGFNGNPGSRFDHEYVLGILREAESQGMNYVDTAPHYGWGKSEKNLGPILSQVPRTSFVISTKVGVELIPRSKNEIPGPGDFQSDEPWKSSFNFSRDGIARSIEGSLERLGLNSIDIAYIHDPDEAVVLMNPSADPYSASHYKQVMEEAVPYLANLRSQGVIRAIGVGINQWQMLRDFANEGCFDVFLVAHQATLLEHSGTAQELAPLCQANKISMVAGSVTHRGILLTGSSPVDGSAPFFNIGPASSEIVRKVERIEEVCREYGVPLQAAAFQFPLLFPATASVLVGISAVSELQVDCHWFNIQIPIEFWRELKSRHLIDEAVPV